jgi:CubicO group peptidase (beta-lactamase class C family)
MMSKTVIAAAAMLFVVAAPALPASDPTDDSLETALLEQVMEVHQKQHNVGLSVTIRRDGSTIFEKEIGLADLENDVPVSANTRFGIASVTKLFTAVALLKLHAAGRVDLDAPIQTYVPRFPSKPEGEITLRLLAEHRSGLPHPNERTPELFATHYETATDAVAVFAGEPLLFAPGTDEKYSSSNYNLIAAAIEGATGKTFPQIVSDSILVPLHLTRTSFDNILRPLSGRSRRYSFYHPWTYQESDTLYVVPLWDYSFNMGGGNLISTSQEVARFGEALVAPGLLPEGELKLLMEWFGAKDDADHTLILVTGSNPGVQAGLAVYPEENISTAILANTWGLGSRSAEMVYLARKLSQTVADWQNSPAQ